MHLMQYRPDLVHKGTRVAFLCSLLVILALLLAACGGGGEEPQPTEAPPAATEAPAATDTPAATEAPAATETPAAGEEITETAEMTETEAVSPTEEVTATEEMTSTEEMTGAEGMTGTEEMTSTEEVTSTEGVTEAAAGAGDAANGEYIATLTGGCGCHFNRDLGALAGGNKFEGPYGVVYAPNITPDPETGIGNWSEEDVAHVLHTGVTPDGTQLVRAMPYVAFSAMSNQEALDVAAYLFSLEPVANQVEARAVTTEPEPFTPDPAPPAEAPTDPVARGQELVTIARCGGCHTPTNEDGTPNMDLYLAGAPLQEDEISANITPSEEFGIGSWSEEEIAHYLQTGERPDGSLAQGSMAQQIERRFHLLTDTDAAAVAAYLKSIPAIEHDPYAD